MTKVVCKECGVAKDKKKYRKIDWGFWLNGYFKFLICRECITTHNSRHRPTLPYQNF